MLKLPSPVLYAHSALQTQAARCSYRTARLRSEAKKISKTSKQRLQAGCFPMKKYSFSVTSLTPRGALGLHLRVSGETFSESKEWLAFAELARDGYERVRNRSLRVEGIVLLLGAPGHRPRLLPVHGPLCPGLRPRTSVVVDREAVAKDFRVVRRLASCATEQLERTVDFPVCSPPPAHQEAQETSCILLGLPAARIPPPRPNTQVCESEPCSCTNSTYSTGCTRVA